MRPASGGVGAESRQQLPMFMMRGSARRQLVAWALLAAAMASGRLGTVASARQALAPDARAAVVATQEGVAKSGVLPATDPESDPITFSVVTPPTKGTLTITNAATGAFTFTPNAGAVGYDTFVYRAADATGGSNAMGSVFIVTAAPTWPGNTTRASVATDGSQLTTPSNMGAWPSADGRFIVFTSGVLDEPTLTLPDVFVRDRQTGQTTLVSRATGSDVSIGGIFPAISADGRYVAFTSLASALPGGHPSGVADMYLHDRVTGQTERVSVSSSGIAGNAESVFGSISADGRYVAFSSTATNLAPGDTDDDNDVYVRDRQLGTTTLVSVSSTGVKGDSGGWLPALSADGRFVSFISESTNLVPDDTNGRIDLFVRDLHSNQTTRVSVSTSGTQANSNSNSIGALSADGRFAVFESDASNLVAGDTNGLRDTFVHDRQTGQTTRVSVSSTGAQGNGDSGNPSLSADGRYVLFESAAANLVAGDTNGLPDVFVHDRQTGQTVRVNVASDGTQANAVSVGDDDGCCAFPTISADGRSAVVVTLASNLVPGDTNGLDDVFVIGPVSVGPTTVDVPGPGGTGTVNVSFAYAGTPWSATTTTPWITIDAPGGGSGNGAVTFTAAPNAGAARSGTITVALKTITVTQPAVTTPQPPTGLFASSIVGNTLTLRFTPPAVGPAPTGFLLEAGVNTGETLASISTGSTAPIFTIEAPDGAFYVRMRTVTAAGTSGPSNEIRVFIDVPHAPSAPTNLLATVSGSNLTLAWQNTNGGGVPTSMVLDVTGSFVGSLSIPLGDGASFEGVPAGTYTVALRAVNGTGSSPASNSVTISFPSTCSGAPLPPANFVVVKTGTNLRLFWDPADSGPAPTDFVITVTGAFNGSVPLVARTISASVAPGSYNLSIQARNACGTSVATAVQTVAVP